MKHIILAAGFEFLNSKPTYQIHGSLVDDTSLKIQIENSCITPNNTTIVTDKLHEKADLPGGVNLVENNNAASHKNSRSLLLGLSEKPDETLVSYCDILCTKEDYSAISESDADICLLVSSDTNKFGLVHSINAKYTNYSREVVLFNVDGYCSSGRNISTKPTEHVAVFVGLLKLSKRATEGILDILKNSRFIEDLWISELVALLSEKGFSIEIKQASDPVSEVRKNAQIDEFIFKTKGITLKKLIPLIKECTIPRSHILSWSDWIENPEEQLVLIKNTFGNPFNLTVRSSASNEDGFLHSNAGAFESVLHIKTVEDLANAIEAVFASYNTDLAGEHVLVQNMVSNVVCSGVIFSKTLEQRAPYIVMNVSFGSETDIITSGSSNADTEVQYFNRIDLQKALENQPDFIRNTIKMVLEIERIVQSDELDIEFAVDNQNNIHLLQVRPLSSSALAERDIRPTEIDLIQGFEAALAKFKTSRFKFLGEWQHAIYSNITDWNPSEIIGNAPKALAYSLYKEIITDNIWAIQRSQFGYENLVGTKLMTRFLGRPYINAHASLASFIPKEIELETKRKLFRHYTFLLRTHPEFHDKVEFEICRTCMTTKWSVHHEELRQYEFTEAEISTIQGALQKITQSAFESIDDHYKPLTRLRKTQAKLIASEEITPFLLSKTLDELRNYGTLPFAHMARHGFVAMSILKDAVECNHLSERAFQEFFQKIETIGSEYTKDLARNDSSEEYLNYLVEKYGHLRPGTYDIASPRYDDDPEFFFSSVATGPADEGELTTGTWEEEKPHLARSLNSFGLSITPDELEQYLISAIEGREKAKWEFTKVLSLLLRKIKTTFEKHGLGVEYVSNLTLENIFHLLNNNFTTELSDLISEAVRSTTIAETWKLPDLLLMEADFYWYKDDGSAGNFVGHKEIISEVVLLKESSVKSDHCLDGKIVFIPSADPGFDWVFSKNIGGLITMFGGANSHMAIRCAEFGIPAAIGIGEENFNHYSKCQSLLLSPKDKVIRVNR